VLRTALAGLALPETDTIRAVAARLAGDTTEMPSPDQVADRLPQLADR